VAQLSLYQALTIFGWFPLAFTLATLLLIARFYERFSAAPTYWRLYTLPIVGYGLAHVREAALALPEDPFADLVQAASGVLLLLLVIRLSALMLRHREAVASVAPPLLMLGGAFGPAGMSVALFMLGRFTRRMVRLNRQPAYHRAYYLAALGMGAAAFLRVLPGGLDLGLTLLYPTLVAASMTTGAVASWRSWSWLLAERA
jgi:hypothetical protein